MRTLVDALKFLGQEVSTQVPPKTETVYCVRHNHRFVLLDKFYRKIYIIRAF